MRCETREETQTILIEEHMGICGSHISVEGPLEGKTLKASY